MAQEKLAFRWLGLRMRHAPSLLQAVWSCVLVATGTYRALFTRVIYTEWLFFALMAIGLHARCAAAIGLRARRLRASPPSWSPSFRSPPTRVQAGTGLLLVVLGLPVYYWTGHAHH